MQFLIYSIIVRSSSLMLCRVLLFTFLVTSPRNFFNKPALKDLEVYILSLNLEVYILGLNLVKTFILRCVCKEVEYYPTLFSRNFHTLMPSQRSL